MLETKQRQGKKRKDETPNCTMFFFSFFAGHQRRHKYLFGEKGKQAFACLCI